MAVRALNGLIGAFNHETLPVTGSATSLTSTVYNIADTGSNGQQVTRKIAQFATITVETDQIRYWLDGTAPDSTHGHLLNINDVLNLSSADDIRNFKAIRVSTTATLQVSYA